MNVLANETSPYLRQHKDNPVHWMPWGDWAFQKAAAENKPVLLSVGYAACHWCHVMAHESFENPLIAQVMNEFFINIKLDREERPDIDALYQHALALMGQQGGWPLTMFLTPDKRPFWGGTYFPPTSRHGLPGFLEVLQGVAESYRSEKEKIAHNAHSLTTALAELHKPQNDALLRPEVMERIALHFLSRMDPLFGGVNTVPKFPNLTIIGFLWDTYARTREDKYKQAVLQALMHMCAGGMHDHIGGGFHRYAVDAQWLVPHFEKMLYDNALFVSLLSDVWRETRHPFLESCLRGTVAFLEREMLKDGAFISSIDADSRDAEGQGHEGLFYVWRESDIDAALGDHALFFKKAYDITKSGNWEGVNIPNRLTTVGAFPAADEEILRHCRKKLRVLRDGRERPARDDKILTDWNGLAVAALARAGFALGEEGWIDLARRVFDTVVEKLSAADNRLMHVYCAGKAAHAGLLEDYAAMIDAALALHEVRPDDKLLAQAKSWMQVLLDDFHDAAQGGFFVRAASDTDVFMRLKPVHDAPLPAGNGMIAGALVRLHYLTGEMLYLEKAGETLTAFAGAAKDGFFTMATYLRSLMFYQNPVFLTLSGRDGAFTERLRACYIPGSLLTRKEQDDGEARLEICFGASCLPPLSDPEALGGLIEESFRKRRYSAANDSG